MPNRVGVRMMIDSALGQVVACLVTTHFPCPHLNPQPPRHESFYFHLVFIFTTTPYLENGERSFKHQRYKLYSAPRLVRSAGSSRKRRECETWPGVNICHSPLVHVSQRFTRRSSPASGQVQLKAKAYPLHVFTFHLPDGWAGGPI